MDKQKTPLFISLIPVLVLIILLSINVWLFGDNTTSGSNQLSLLIAGAVAAVIGGFYGVSWKSMLEGAVKSISSAMSALIILLQIILGIFTVLSGANILIASLHQFSSILLITASLYFLYKNKYNF